MSPTTARRTPGRSRLPALIPFATGRGAAGRYLADVVLGTTSAPSGSYVDRARAARSPPWQRNGTWHRAPHPHAAPVNGRREGCDHMGLSVDSTGCRAHQHAAGARKEGDDPKGGREEPCGPAGVLWSSKTGATPDDVDRFWQALLRRFDLEHIFRFAEQTLGWTTPKLRTPPGGGPLDLHPDRRSHPAPARPASPRRPPPAQGEPTTSDRLTPARVPKPRGIGPGRPPGAMNIHRASRHDVGKTEEQAGQPFVERGAYPVGGGCLNTPSPDRP